MMKWLEIVRLIVELWPLVELLIARLSDEEKGELAQGIARSYVAQRHGLPVGNLTAEYAGEITDLTLKIEKGMMA